MFHTIFIQKKKLFINYFKMYPIIIRSKIYFIINYSIIRYANHNLIIIELMKRTKILFKKDHIHKKRVKRLYIHVLNNIPLWRWQRKDLQDTFAQLNGICTYKWTNYFKQNILWLWESLDSKKLLLIKILNEMLCHSPTLLKRIELEHTNYSN